MIQAAEFSTSSVDIEFIENIAKVEKVGDEKKRPQDRAVWHTCTDWGGVGFERFRSMNWAHNNCST